MTEQDINALYAHAGKLVAERKPLSGVLEYYDLARKEWLLFVDAWLLPCLTNGWEWRIAKPKKQPIDWSHEYFKGCATNYGELVYVYSGAEHVTTHRQSPDGLTQYAHDAIDLRLASPANEHVNWQPFFSTPENDAKLRELAKMVKVEVRRWSHSCGCYVNEPCEVAFKHDNQKQISNYRITGLQDGWTDNKEEV